MHILEKLRFRHRRISNDANINISTKTSPIFRRFMHSPQELQQNPTLHFQMPKSLRANRFHHSRIQIRRLLHRPNFRLFLITHLHRHFLRRLLLFFQRISPSSTTIQKVRHGHCRIIRRLIPIPFKSIHGHNTRCHKARFVSELPHSQSLQTPHSPSPTTCILPPSQIFTTLWRLPRPGQSTRIRNDHQTPHKHHRITSLTPFHHFIPHNHIHAPWHTSRWHIRRILLHPQLLPICKNAQWKIQQEFSFIITPWISAQYRPRIMILLCDIFRQEPTFLTTKGSN